MITQPLPERLAFLLSSADEWLLLRQLRNRMVHEYVKDPVLLADALQSAHQGVPTLQACAQTLKAEIQRRSAQPTP